MGKEFFKLLLIVLCGAITFCGTAPAASSPETGASAHSHDISNERNTLRYHLATLPSTNRNRVNAMCIKFLSLLPKAKLIPKTEKSTVYRLVANTYDKIEPARKRKTELSHTCESPFVTTEETGYAVIAGSQLTEALALAEQKRMAAKNIPTQIHELRIPLRNWQMISSESFTIREAVTMAGKLATIGVVTTLEPASNQIPSEKLTP